MNNAPTEMHREAWRILGHYHLAPKDNAVRRTTSLIQSCRGRANRWQRVLSWAAESFVVDCETIGVVPTFERFCLNRKAYTDEAAFTLQKMRELVELYDDPPSYQLEDTYPQLEGDHAPSVPTPRYQVVTLGTPVLDHHAS